MIQKHRDMYFNKNCDEVLHNLNLSIVTVRENREKRGLPPIKSFDMTIEHDKAVKNVILGRKWDFLFMLIEQGWGLDRFVEHEGLQMTLLMIMCKHTAEFRDTGVFHQILDKKPDVDVQD